MGRASRRPFRGTERAFHGINVFSPGDRAVPTGTPPAARVR
jgi:hypothetical protein